ncbi:MAG: recombinase family protein, partial [Actinobacteria bacterium]|nr:recombinase family protein [Actinomycetota bacterium]
QGFNVGKPPYGYRPVQVRLDGSNSDGPHPTTAHDSQGGLDLLGGGVDLPGRGGGHRGKGRTGPRTKTRLVPDPVEAETVRRIYAWRIAERIGYQMIAERLNLDLRLNPPPSPPDMTRAVGRWTAGSVREVLVQPKYTGYMVWNRRAMKTRSGSPNPVEAWVWSSRPVHDPIVDLDTFIAAQQVTQRRERSRSQPGRNRHPQTKRSYLLRSYVFCAACGRRMFGKTRRKAFYACAPKSNQTRPAGHPDSLWVAEEELLEGLSQFLADHVFGSYRRQLLSANLKQLDQSERDEHAQRVAAAEKALDSVEQRRRRLLHILEMTDDPDPDLLRDISSRRAELTTEQDQLTSVLRRLRQQRQHQPNIDLLDTLPVGAVDITALPEALARQLFEALRLELHYDKERHTARYRVTLAGDTVSTAQTTAHAAIHQATNNRTDDPGPVSDEADRFPSAMCPRQDSNLRRTV